MFHRFDSRFELVGTLITESGLHIGSRGSLAVVGSDNPVIRDVNALPFIPGSSFKGVLRSLIEAIVRTISPGGRQYPWACDPLNDQRWCIRRGRVLNQGYNPEEKYPEVGFEDLEVASDKDEEKLASWITKESCTVCNLFGSPWIASKVKVKDLYLKDGSDWRGRIEIRDGVGIDRDTETAAEKRKYDYEVVPRYTAFDLRIRVDNASPKELGLLFLALQEFKNGGAWLGGMTSRGLGLVKIDWDHFETIKGRDQLVSYLKEGHGNLIKDGALEQFVAEKIQTFLASLRKEGSDDVQKNVESRNP